MGKGAYDSTGGVNNEKFKLREVEGAETKTLTCMFLHLVEVPQSSKGVLLRWGEVGERSWRQKIIRKAK